MCPKSLIIIADIDALVLHTAGGGVIKWRRRARIVRRRLSAYVAAFYGDSANGLGIFVIFSKCLYSDVIKE